MDADVFIWAIRKKRKGHPRLTGSHSYLSTMWTCLTLLILSTPSFASPDPSSIFQTGGEVRCSSVCEARMSCWPTTSQFSIMVVSPAPLAASELQHKSKHTHTHRSAYAVTAFQIVGNSLLPVTWQHRSIWGAKVEVVWLFARWEAAVRKMTFLTFLIFKIKIKKIISN